MKKLIPLILLAGCASQQEMTDAYLAQRAVVEAQTAATVPLITIECGTAEDACKGLSFAYNPRNPIVVPVVTNTNDVLKESIRPITDMLTTGSIVFGAVRLGKSMMENGGSGNTNVRNTNINNGDNSTLEGHNDLGTSDPLVVESTHSQISNIVETVRE